jgi:hypothetical protein
MQMPNWVQTWIGLPVEIEVTQEDRELFDVNGDLTVERAMTRILKRPVQVVDGSWCFLNQFPREWRKLPREVRQAMVRLQHRQFEPFRFRVLL